MFKNYESLTAWLYLTSNDNILTRKAILGSVISNTMTVAANTCGIELVEDKKLRFSVFRP